MPTPPVPPSSPIPAGRWQAVRAAVAETGDRFAELVRSSPDPAALATRDWSIAETAAHVASMAWLYTSMVEPAPDGTGGTGGTAIRAIADQMAVTTVDTVHVFNDVTMRQFTERDPAVLAGRLRADLDLMLRRTEDLDPGLPVTWLGQSKVPVAGIVAHMLNELLVHGRDIARATRTTWPIPPHYSALFFDLFMLPVLRYDIGRLLDNDEPPRQRRIAAEFRSAHTDPVTVVLHRGVVSVEEPGGPVDIRLSFDPTTLILMMFHRISRPRAVLTGRVVIRGRRPWLVFRFLRTVRLP